MAFSSTSGPKKNGEHIFIHVYGHGGSAKFWLEPTVSLSKTTGLSKRDLLQLWTVVDERKDQLIETWHEYH